MEVRGLLHAPVAFPPQGNSHIIHYAEGYADPGTGMCAMRRDPLASSGMAPRSLGHLAYGVLTVSTVLKRREDTEEQWRGKIVLQSLKR
jgi:hypothetical protein